MKDAPPPKKYNPSLDPNYSKVNPCCKSSDISRNGVPVIFFIRMFMDYMYLIGIGLLMENKYPF